MKRARIDAEILARPSRFDVVAASTTCINAVQGGGVAGPSNENPGKSDAGANARRAAQPGAGDFAVAGPASVTSTTTSNFGDKRGRGERGGRGGGGEGRECGTRERSCARLRTMAGAFGGGDRGGGGGGGGGGRRGEGGGGGGGRRGREGGGGRGEIGRAADRSRRCRKSGGGGGRGEGGGGAAGRGDRDAVALGRAPRATTRGAGRRTASECVDPRGGGGGRDDCLEGLGRSIRQEPGCRLVPGRVFDPTCAPSGGSLRSSNITREGDKESAGSSYSRGRGARTPRDSPLKRWAERPAKGGARRGSPQVGKKKAIVAMSRNLDVLLGGHRVWVTDGGGGREGWGSSESSGSRSQRRRNLPEQLPRRGSTTSEICWRRPR